MNNARILLVTGGKDVIVEWKARLRLDQVLGTVILQAGKKNEEGSKKVLKTPSFMSKENRSRRYDKRTI